MNVNPFGNLNNDNSSYEMTVNAGEMEEAAGIAFQAPMMSDEEAAAFMKDIGEKGMDALKEELGEKQFLIKCLRAAKYTNALQNPFRKVVY